MSTNLIAKGHRAVKDIFPELLRSDGRVLIHLPNIKKTKKDTTNYSDFLTVILGKRVKYDDFGGGTSSRYTPGVVIRPNSHNHAVDLSFSYYTASTDILSLTCVIISQSNLVSRLQKVRKLYDNDDT